MIIFILIILFIFSLCLLFRFLNFKSICSLIRNYNTCIGGLRGTGKDMIMSNYVARSHSKSYISNVDYKVKNKTFIPLNLSALDIRNNFDNFINGNINFYAYPYSDNIPILISDCSLYFPSAYESELKKSYRGLVNFMPLSRHLGDTNICVNAQNISQVWDKIRNQSDIYILCMSCKVLLHRFVFMRVRIYEKYDSFISRVPPYRAPRKRLKDSALVDTHKISYIASYGNILTKRLFFIHKSKYDSRFMKTLLNEGA